MTKEELEKEAEEYASMYARQYLHNDGSGLTNSYCEVYNDYYQSAEPREKQIAELEAENERLQKINNEQKETLKKVRVALIQERTANIMNFGKGGVEMFDSMFEILKGVSN